MRQRKRAGFVLYAYECAGLFLVLWGKLRVKVTFPEKLEFLSEPHRYKVLYGGRGGIKSWSIAQHLLITGAPLPQS